MRGNRLVTALLFLAATAAHAQVVESIEVRVTSVDVVVTDRDGKPVTGLTKDDFEILEDKRPQKITNFYEVRGGESVQAMEQTTQAAPAPAAKRRNGRRRRLRRQRGRENGL